MDIVFIAPSISDKAYQELAKVYSAIETPTWALLLAESCRSKGFDCKIIDATAEGLSDKEVSKRLEDINPKFALLVVYGQNPNAGTTGMIGATRTCDYIKSINPNRLIGMVGSHPSALPKEVLENTKTDIVFTNEGVYALHEILSNLRNGKEIKEVNGIGYYKNGKPHLNPPMKIVPEDRMDTDLPGYAWDLLPYKEKPLDLYRSHFWHSEFRHDLRTPFAAIYTSLGCVFGCEFCMVNILNRQNNDDGIHAGDSRFMRYWSTEWVLKELKKLHEMGVYTLRFSDEMFFFKEEKYGPILDGIIKNNFKFNIWTYARVDTVRKKELKRFKKAGVNWLCLGIEAGNRIVRQEISKGSFKDVKVEEIVKDVQSCDISILGNYIFGFPHDTLETMQQTLDLALDLNTEHANFYACTALPGSALYFQAKAKGWYIPESTNYEEFAFLSYEHVPLPTNTLTAAEVLEFRDNAWNKYFSNKNFHNLVEKKFGNDALKNLTEMSKVKLKRKLLGDVLS